MFGLSPSMYSGGGGDPWSSLGWLGGPWGMAATSFGLPFLGTLLGGGGAQRNAFKQWEAQRQNVMSPNFLHNRTSTYLPMMQQLAATERGGILTAGNAFQNSLSRNLAASGANRSGIGVLAATAASSMPALRLNDLQGEVRRGAMSMAMNDRDTMMRMLSEGPQSMENPWLDALGRGSNTFMSYLMNRGMYGQGQGYRGYS
jgi:hypothetical protein